MKYFITDDTALAAYLYLCGMKFVEATVINEQNPRRKKFIIYDTPDRKSMEEDFYMRKTTVAPLDFHDARVHVSRFLKYTVTDPERVLI